MSVMIFFTPDLDSGSRNERTPWMMDHISRDCFTTPSTPMQFSPALYLLWLPSHDLRELSFMSRSLILTY
jgi:hypothetical protein